MLKFMLKTCFICYNNNIRKYKKLLHVCGVKVTNK